MHFHEGMDVILDTGDLLIPGTVESTTPHNTVLVQMKAILVRFSPSARSWVEPDHLRPMLLDDHRRVYGTPFHTWLRCVWYTLVFRYGLCFTKAGIGRDDLYAAWVAGWSESATITKLEHEQGWHRFPPAVYPAYIAHLVADLGDEDADQRRLV